MPTTTETQSWMDEIIAERKLTGTVAYVSQGPDTFTVVGSKGDVYTVSYAGALDDDVDTWDCTCPARVTCKHIKLVASIMGEFCDLCGY